MAWRRWTEASTSSDGSEFRLRERMPDSQRRAILLEQLESPLLSKRRDQLLCILNGIATTVSGSGARPLLLRQAAALSEDDKRALVKSSVLPGGPVSRQHPAVKRLLNEFGGGQSVVEVLDHDLNPVGFFSESEAWVRFDMEGATRVGTTYRLRDSLTAKQRGKATGKRPKKATTLLRVGFLLKDAGVDDGTAERITRLFDRCM